MGPRLESRSMLSASPSRSAATDQMPPATSGPPQLGPQAVPEILPSKVFDCLKSKESILVDLRCEKDRLLGVIENSIHIPAVDHLGVPFETRVSRLVGLCQEQICVVFAAVDSSTSAQACAQSYRQQCCATQTVVVLSGGIAAWKSAGLPIHPLQSAHQWT